MVAKINAMKEYNELLDLGAEARAKDWRIKELEKINTRLRSSLNRLYSSVSDGEHLDKEWIEEALLAEPNGVAVESLVKMRSVDAIKIKELESIVLDLQSELARKKMSLTVACNRVEELEDKLTKCQEIAMGLGIKYNEQQDKLNIAVEALKFYAQPNKWEPIEDHEGNELMTFKCGLKYHDEGVTAAKTLEQLGELK